MASRAKQTNSATKQQRGTAQMQLPETRKQLIRETDSDYTRLAKMGGHPDLLRIRTPPSRNDKAVPYQRVDWFYQDDIKKERDHSTKENATKVEAEHPDGQFRNYRAELPNDYSDYSSYEDRLQHNYSDDISSREKYENQQQEYRNNKPASQVDWYYDENTNGAHEQGKNGVSNSRGNKPPSQVNWYYDDDGRNENNPKNGAMANYLPSDENVGYIPTGAEDKPSRRASGLYQPKERAAPFAQEESNIFQSEGDQAINKTLKIQEPRKQGFGIRRDKEQYPKPVENPDNQFESNPVIDRKQAILAKRTEDAVNMTKLLSFGYMSEHGDQKQLLKERNRDGPDGLSNSAVSDSRRRSKDILLQAPFDNMQTEYQAKMAQADVAALRLKDEYISRKMKAQDTAMAARGTGIYAANSGPGGDSYVPSSHSYGSNNVTSVQPSDPRTPSSQQAYRPGRRMRTPIK